MNFERPAWEFRQSSAFLTQQDSALLTGVVVANETGNVLPNAIVLISALNVERLANQRGAFTLTGVRAGKYRLRVRQL